MFRLYPLDGGVDVVQKVLQGLLPYVLEHGDGNLNVKSD